jgi:hypothetical protein
MFFYFYVGRTYHFMPKSTRGSGCYYFLFSNDDALEQHGAKFDVNSDFLHDFKAYLAENNKLCKQYVTIGEEIIANDENNVNDAQQAILNIATHDFEISAITSENFGEGMERVVRVILKNNGGRVSISSTSQFFEPLCYPMLFTDGEDGWHEAIKNEISFNKYMVIIFIFCLRLLLIYEKKILNNYFF